MGPSLARDVGDSVIPSNLSSSAKPSIKHRIFERLPPQPAATQFEPNLCYILLSVVTSLTNSFVRTNNGESDQLTRLSLTNLRYKPNMSNSGSHRARQLVLISRKMKGRQGTIVHHRHPTHLPPKMPFVINNRPYLLWRHYSRVMN